MTEQKQREIVIEFEKIQTIRRRARTHLLYCGRCGSIGDKLPLAEAAELFETMPENLFDFVTQNDCHYHLSQDNQAYLCLVSLLGKLKKLDNARRLTAKGENIEYI